MAGNEAAFAEGTNEGTSKLSEDGIEKIGVTVAGVMLAEGTEKVVVGELSENGDIQERVEVEDVGSDPGTETKVGGVIEVLRTAIRRGRPVSIGSDSVSSGGGSSDASVRSLLR